jgi:hypothetical protein
MVAKYLNERGLAVLKALDEVAAEYRSTPARVALAWLIARPGVTAPIASATSESQRRSLSWIGGRSRSCRQCRCVGQDFILQAGFQPALS